MRASLVFFFSYGLPGTTDCRKVGKPSRSASAAVTATSPSAASQYRCGGERASETIGADGPIGARAAVLAKINPPPLRDPAPGYGPSMQRIECVILDEATIERKWGWVFFYQSKRYVETGEPGALLAGNAPYIVNRDEGTLHETGTARGVEHYIEEYEKRL